MERLGNIPNPDDVFDGINVDQIRTIKSDIFYGFFNTKHQDIEKKIASVILSIDRAVTTFGMTEQQAQRLINIANMMKDPTSNVGHLRSFRNKMQTIIPNNSNQDELPWSDIGKAAKKAQQILDSKGDQKGISHRKNISNKDC